MKKTFLFLLALVLAITVSADDIKDFMKLKDFKFFTVKHLDKDIRYITTSDTEVAVFHEESEKENNDTYSGKITIPSKVTYEGKTYTVTAIHSYAFSGCEKLKSITIPNSVTTIERGAFAYCRNLKSLTIPESVKTIGECAFSTALEELTVLSTTPPAMKPLPKYDAEKFESCTVKVLASAVEAYKKAEGWKDFKSIVEI